MSPLIPLNNGQKLPQIGYGTFQITDFEDCKQAVLKALDLGYRLIDTAQIYQNEAAVGAALQETHIPRSEIFVTTKVWISNYGQTVTEKSIEDSLDRMGLTYFDLVLLHEPYGDYYAAYRDLEKLVMQGKIKTIGVSNFDAGQLLDLMHQMRITPAVNQIEVNIYQQQHCLQAFQTQHGIVTQAWAPLGETSGPILVEPIVVNLAHKYRRSPAQILLRFLIQLGVTVIPKAIQVDHMRENIQLGDFELTAVEMKQLTILDKKKWLSPSRHSLCVTQHYMELMDAGLNLKE